MLSISQENLKTITDLEIKRRLQEMDEVLCFLLTEKRDKVIFDDNCIMLFTPPYTPLLSCKIGVYRGIHYFFILL